MGNSETSHLNLIHKAGGKTSPIAKRMDVQSHLILIIEGLKKEIEQIKNAMENDLRHEKTQDIVTKRLKELRNRMTWSQMHQVPPTGDDLLELSEIIEQQAEANRGDKSDDHIWQQAFIRAIELLEKAQECMNYLIRLNERDEEILQGQKGGDSHCDRENEDESQV